MSRDRILLSDSKHQAEKACSRLRPYRIPLPNLPAPASAAPRTEKDKTPATNKPAAADDRSDPNVLFVNLQGHLWVKESLCDSIQDPTLLERSEESVTVLEVMSSDPARR